MNNASLVTTLDVLKTLRTLLPDAPSGQAFVQYDISCSTLVYHCASSLHACSCLIPDSPTSSCYQVMHMLQHHLYGLRVCCWYHSISRRNWHTPVEQDKHSLVCCLRHIKLTCTKLSRLNLASQPCLWFEGVVMLDRHRALTKPPYISRCEGLLPTLVHTLPAFYVAFEQSQCISLFLRTCLLASELGSISPSSLAVTMQPVCLACGFKSCLAFIESVTD